MGLFDFLQPRPNIEKLKSNRDIRGLVKAARHKDYSIKRDAVKSLVELHDPCTVELLIADLNDSNEYVREIAAGALGKIGDVRAVDPLIAALKDSNEIVRFYAVLALGEIGDTRAVDPLVAALGDMKSIVRDKAAEVLQCIGDSKTRQRARKGLDEWAYRKSRETNILKTLASNKGSQADTETPSMHTLVTNEIRFMLEVVLLKRCVATKEDIVKETKHSMSWFKIRPRQYGESGSNFGVPEIVSSPAENHIWPTWLKLIPTSELQDIGRDISTLIKERRPLGGHLMEDENRRRAVCEFADHLLWRLLSAERENRLADPHA